MVRERLAERNRLGAFVLVVREAQVLATAVQVEALAEQVEAHHDALRVPARAPVAPWRRPRRIAVGGRAGGELPQHEVGRMPLAGRADHLAIAPTRAHVVDGLMGEQAVVVDGLDRHVHAVVGDVGVVEFDQLTDHLDHLVDVVGGVGRLGGALEVDGVHRLPPDRLAPGGDVLPGPLLSQRALDDLVFDVGDVGHEAHIEAGPFEVAAQDVVHERGATVAQVRRAVHGGTTQVDADLARLAKSQLAHGSRGGVVEVQHGVRVYGCPPTSAGHRFPSSPSTSSWDGPPEPRRKQPGQAVGASR